MAAGGVAGAEGDERRADGGDGEGEPAGEVHALVREEGGGDREHHGHGADHERGVGDGGAARPENWMRNWRGTPRKAQRRRVRQSRR